MSVADFAQMTGRRTEREQCLHAALHDVNLFCPCPCRRALGNKSSGSRASPLPSWSGHTHAPLRGSSAGSSSPIHIRSHAHGHTPCTQIRSFPHGHTHSLTCALPLSCLSQPQTLFISELPHPTPPRPPQIFSSRDERSFSYLRRKVTAPFEK